MPSPDLFFLEAYRALKPGGLLIIGFEPNKWPYYTFMPIVKSIMRLLGSGQKDHSVDSSIADEETHGFNQADFNRFMKVSGFHQVDLQHIWYVGGFIHLLLLFINRRREANEIIELPDVIQRAIVSLDDILSRLPLFRKLCWHWTLIARKVI